MSIRDRLVRTLLDERNERGWWTGELSTSALSTATASFALFVIDRERRAGGKDVDDSLPELVRGGLRWLAENQNEDGGWGDTIRSKSNISTTTLCACALHAVDVRTPEQDAALDRAKDWLTRRAGSLESARLAEAITEVYGEDRTFSVPILTMGALSGFLGPANEAWKLVKPLPFELAALPHGLFRFLGLPVVSYALPALIAIGQARFVHRPGLNPITRIARSITRQKTLRVLESIQPVGGGFLEATPLTSFVAMSLAGSGQVGHAVTKSCEDFLLRSVREDGSWPIDTNLATWVTTLSVNTLASTGELHDTVSAEERKTIADWLLGQQYREVHPYTQAAPGAWAWTDLPGGVPDADDTAGALLALWNLEGNSERARAAAELGITWLLDLQNRDVGIPTFCRGWGKLPFDRSGADLTAHVLRAFLAWRETLEAWNAPLYRRVESAIPRMISYLAAQQRGDGAWCPLWFGNEHEPQNENPCFGTSRVVRALREATSHGVEKTETLVHRAVSWLVEAQNDDGGWGGTRGLPSTIEETSLAIDALIGRADAKLAIGRGREWLQSALPDHGVPRASPIGFYFANLWYYEQLYPLIFAVSAARSDAIDS